MNNLSILLLTLLISTTTFSQNSYKFDHVTVDDGLSQSTVLELFQDSQGVMWIGTANGLNKYDGINITSFYNDREESNSLVSDRIQSIAEDSKGNIWIGTDKGLNIYSQQYGSLKRIPISEEEGAFSGGNIRDIVIGKNNTIWFASDKGLVQYDAATSLYNQFKLNTLEFGADANIISSILYTVSGKLLVATDADPIFEFIPELGSFKPIYYLQNGISDKNTEKHMVEVAPEQIYITAVKAGLHIHNLETGETNYYGVDTYGLNSDIIHTGVIKIKYDEIWIGTDGGGVNIFNPITKAFTYHTHNLVYQNSISSGGIYKLFADKNQNIWVGHYGTGISIYRKNKEKFMSYRPNPFDTMSIANGVVTSSLEDSQGRIWIGVDGGGLNLFDRQTGHFTKFTHKANDTTSLSTNKILCLAQDNDGRILIGTYQKGLMVFDPALGKVVEHFNESDGLSQNTILKIYKSSDGLFYLSTYGNGIDIFNTETKKFVNQSPFRGADPFFCSVVRSITEDKGNLWFGGSDGVGIYNFGSDSSVVYWCDENDLNSLADNNVTAIEIKDDYAWLATKKGLNKLNYKTGELSLFNVKNSGFVSNTILGMLADNNNNLWLSSVKGLMKFNIITQKVTNYNKSQGLQGNEFRYNSESLLSDGTMIFGGNNGITLFHPDSIQPSSIEAPLIFTSLKVNNTEAVIGGKNSVLKKHINFTKSLILKNKHKSFSLKFASLDYTSSKRNEFEYMLDGFHETFVHAGNTNEVTFTNLSPGRYTLIVRGSNSDGVFADNLREIKIRVRPPWYRSSFFIFIVVVSALFSIVRIIRRRDEKAEQDKAILQSKIDESEKLAQAKIDEVEQKKQEIIEKEREEFEIRYLQKGISYFSKVISQTRNNIEELFSVTISEIVRYIEANVGAIYLVDDEESGTRKLQKAGSYCHDGENNNPTEVLEGEGYIGTCFKTRELTYLDNLPEGFIVMTSGLGEVSMAHSLLVPLIHNNECVGVIEIASLEHLPQYKVDLLTNLAESLASVLIIARANERTKVMLEENRAQAEELLAQEEEMRQNMEEMKAAKEELQSQLETKAQSIGNDINLEDLVADVLLKDSHEHIYFKDLDSRFLKVSESMVPHFQLNDAGEIIGRTDFDLFDKTIAKNMRADEERIIKTGIALKDKIETRYQQGAKYVFATTKMPLKNENGEIVGTFGISKDITFFARLQEEHDALIEKSKDCDKEMRRVQIELRKKDALIRELQKKIMKG